MERPNRDSEEESGAEAPSLEALIKREQTASHRSVDPQWCSTDLRWPVLGRHLDMPA